MILTRKLACSHFSLFDVCQLTKDSKQHQHSPMKSLQFRSIGERIHSIKGLAFIRMSPVRRTLSLSITSLTSNINAMEELYCIFCSEIVTSRQEALLCGGCEKWQHRRCHTGVDRATYRQAVRDGQDISWTCLYCKEETPVPIAASSMIHRGI